MPLTNSIDLLNAVSGKSSGLAEKLPDPPKFPDSFLKRFPEMGKWWDDWKDYEQKKARIKSVA
ncbi:MAG: hypothetical protein RL254_968 [Planctomycetota bacterium]|jgi:hypothetical protein